MDFKFHLYVQRHHNRTYTVTPLPFYDLTVYGNNLDEIKEDIIDALKQRIPSIPAGQLHQFEFNPKITLQKVQVEVRPIDRKKRNKRREKIRLTFSLLIEPTEDNQFYVRVPRLGQYGPSFYVFELAELPEQAEIELVSWLDGSTLEQLQSYQHARSETLETLEVEVNLKKASEIQSEDGSP
jgi:hypothetical protein